jgi:hypothetical protein
MARGITSGPSSPVALEPVQFETENRSIGSADEAVQIVYPAPVGAGRHIIEGVAWSYNDTPTGGNLQIDDGAGHIFFEIDITASGPGFIPFSPEMSSQGVQLIITLAAGGQGVIGKLNVIGHRRV